MNLPGGAETIGYASEDDLTYASHEFVVIRLGGAYYWASDSTCSCSSPFADLEFPEDFYTGSAVDALNALTDWSTGYGVEDSSLRTALMQEGAGIVSRIDNTLRWFNTLHP